MKRFVVMLTFLTRIPIPIKFDVDNIDYVKGVVWTPLIAIIIGVPLFFTGMLSEFLNPYILSVFILAIYLMLSGALHIDGLADTMDAFGSNRGKSRMLEILKDTKMGTFGVLSIVIYCVGMVALIPFAPPFSLLLFPLVGRSAALLCARTNDYAREDGLGKSFVQGARHWHNAISIVLYLGLAYLVVRSIGLQSVLAVVVPALLSVAITWLVVCGMSKKLGGITGDLIGFSIEFTQISFLLFVYIATVIFAQVGV
ncbi:MAG: adenosylcobinamide-GDP ribazoletransferase [Clostridia bacterium]|jgi:adenosylcobinamide-GDP ribazoletransferase|nr:adenosylcobinamide-GDP ribazoletransferase [Clostridia bacterium]